MIKRWADLEEAFCNHFEGAYTKPDTSWDLLGCKHKTSEILHDYIKRFTQHKNKLEDVPGMSSITAFTTRVDSEPLIRDIRRRKNISLQDMFALAHDYADGKDCFNASNSKYKSQLTNDADRSPLTKRDRMRRGELVANAEKQEGNKPKQSHGSHAKFDEIMNQTCQNHGFPVNHLARDRHTYKHEIIDAARTGQRAATQRRGKTMPRKMAKMATPTSRAS
jgi:hypothetical protein